jgi:hypothetical protein
MTPAGAIGSIRRPAGEAGDRSAHLDVRREDPQPRAAADGAFRCRQLLADLLWAGCPTKSPSIPAPS